jgi:trimeric autotransporter adhesin
LPKAGDHLWVDQFGLPSVDGSISCVVRFGSDLIVGGSFRQIGGVFANNIARWDGAGWHPLGNGLERTVTCLAVYHGSLFVGGSFQFVDGQLSLHLARWDGAAWFPLGAQMGSYYCCYTMTSLTVYRDELIAAGDFGAHVQPAVQGIRRWDGITWRPLGTGVNGPVQTMLVAGDSLYVAGTFDTAGGAPARNVALWNGSNWAPLGSGISREWGEIRALARFQEHLFAGGSFDSAGSVATGGLASWDGTAWSGVEGFEPGRVSALSVYDGQLHVARDPDLVRWDGVVWSDVSQEFRGEPWLLLPDEGGLIAAGPLSVGNQWPAGDGTPRAFSIARWDGAGWTNYEPWNPRMNGLLGFGGFPSLVQCLASFQGKLVAGGRINYAGTGDGWKVANEVSLWDGSQWTGIPFGPPDFPFGTPNALLAEGDTLYAAGEFHIYPGALNSPALRWAGSEWTRLDTLSTTGTCLMRYRGELMLGTGRYSSPGQSQAGVYGWTGTKWRPIGPTAGPDEFHGVTTLTVHDGLLVAAGFFTSIDGLAANGIAAWNGSSWQSFGGGPVYLGNRPHIMGVVSDKGTLIAAGGFPGPSGDVPLMAWDGTTWSRFPGIRGYATALSLIRGTLFLSGTLEIESSGEKASVVMWDGLAWRALGSGVNGHILAFHEHDGSLYAGGYFSAAGGKSSYGIARWNGLMPAPRIGAMWLSQGRPNPFRAVSDFSFEIKQSGRVRVVVHDARGHEVTVIENGVRSTGTYAARWDGRDRSGKRVSTGIYFILVQQADGASVSRKVVLLQ